MLLDAEAVSVDAKGRIQSVQKRGSVLTVKNKSHWKKRMMSKWQSNWCSVYPYQDVQHLCLLLP